MLSESYKLEGGGGVDKFLLFVPLIWGGTLAGHNLLDHCEFFPFKSTIRESVNRQ